MRKSTTLLSVLLLLCSASLASAQIRDIEALNSGTITISQLADPYVHFDFDSHGTVIRGFIPSGNGVVRPNCLPCAAGQQVIVDGFFFSEKIGSLTANGVTRSMYIRSRFFLTGAPMTIPHRYTRLPFKVTLPATVRGKLTGFDRNPFVGDPGPPLFDTDVNLQGTVTLTFKFSGFHPSVGATYYVKSVVYNF